MYLCYPACSSLRRDATPGSLSHNRGKGGKEFCEHGALATMDEEQNEGVPITNVMILYVGGTIGMKPTDRGLAPAPNYLTKTLSKRPQFHDPLAPPLTTKITKYGKRIHYKIKEYSTLLDSSNSK